jgi:hypothetical protein
MEMNNNIGPATLQLIKEHHDTLVARYPEQAKTLKLLKRNYQ